MADELEADMRKSIEQVREANRAVSQSHRDFQILKKQAELRKTYLLKIETLLSEGQWEQALTLLARWHLDETTAETTAEF